MISDRMKRILLLRRSNAATPIKNKKKYSRKKKHVDPKEDPGVADG